MAFIGSAPSDNGQIRQFLYSASLVASFLPDPSATITLSFDESTNSALVADMQANLGQYALVLVNSVATLQKNGVAVTIAAPSALYSLQSTILNGIPDTTLRAVIVALWSGTATAQQQQRAFAYALLKLKQAGLI